MKKSVRRTEIIDAGRRRTLLTIAALVIAPRPALAASRGLQPFDPRPPAPALRLPTISGTLRDRAWLEGQVLIVNFWSVWCRPCRDEMPALRALHARLGWRGLALWGVAVGDEPEMVAQFAAEQGLDFPLLPDSDRRVAEHWDVSALPTTDVVDKWGRLAFRFVGEASWDTAPLSDRIEALLQE